MNMNLYGHDDAWLMVDCGVSFNEPLHAPYLDPDFRDSKSQVSPNGEPCFDRVCADPSFITRQIENLVGIVITHAHEDHLGALVDLWPRLKCPVYTTRFTAVCLRHKIADKPNSLSIPIIEVQDGERRNVGPFEIQWLALTHSLPESHSLVIRTRVGTIFHTGDWKIDKQPVVGEPFNPEPFKQLANENIEAMVCDSTNADRVGRTPSEGDCHRGLLHEVQNYPGRILATCFGSNIARLITLCRVAKESKRYVGLIGRSINNMVRHARASGHWPSELNELLYHTHQLGYLPPEDILLIATGSQGEPRAALSKLAKDQFRDIQLEPGDKVIFSAIKIPGNEEKIEKLISQLKLKKIEVVTNENSEKTIHASGHPSQQDLLDLYNWVQPQLAIPTHGEPMHLEAHVKVAKDAGITRQLSGRNGDLFEITTRRVHRGFASTGRIQLEDSPPKPRTSASTPQG